MRKQIIIKHYLSVDLIPDGLTGFRIEIRTKDVPDAKKERFPCVSAESSSAFSSRFTKCANEMSDDHKSQSALTQVRVHGEITRKLNFCTPSGLISSSF